MSRSVSDKVEDISVGDTITYNGEPKYVKNELLAYIQYYINRSTKENLKNVIIRSFSSEDVSVAKTILWSGCQAVLGSMDTRHASAVRTIKEADAADIINGFDKLDKSPFDMPTYVAVDIEKIPKIAPEDMEFTSIFERLSIREQRVSFTEGRANANCDTIKALQLTVQEELLTIDKSKSMIKVPEDSYAGILKKPMVSSSAPHKETKQTNAINSVWEMEDHKALDRNTVKLPGTEAPYEKPQKSGRLSQISKLQMSDSYQTKNTENSSVTSADGFRLSREEIRKRRRVKQRRDAVYGKRQHTSLRGGPKITELFIFNVCPDTSDNDLKDFIENEGIEILSLNCISHQESIMKSFKLSVDVKFKDTIMEADFWPEGIACRKYFRPRINNNVFSHFHP